MHTPEMLKDMVEALAEVYTRLDIPLATADQQPESVQEPAPPSVRVSNPEVACAV